MRELHLFAGAGGGILGGMLLGHTCVCAVEIEPYCRKVLLQRQRDGILPKFPIWDNIKTFRGEPWRGRVDVVCGGFPCQDISSAGTCVGIEGERSGLWGEMARVVCEVRPKYVFVENSPMLVIRGLGTVLRDLAKMGYDAKWGVLGACHVEAPHERKRLWILATNSNSQRSQENSHKNGIRKKTYNNRSARQPSLFRSERIWFNPRPIGAYPMGVGNGMAFGVDRIKAAGNGQVPSVVKLAWETLIK